MFTAFYNGQWQGHRGGAMVYSNYDINQRGQRACAAHLIQRVLSATPQTQSWALFLCNLLVHSLPTQRHGQWSWCAAEMTRGCFRARPPPQAIQSVCVTRGCRTQSFHGIDMQGLDLHARVCPRWPRIGRACCPRTSHRR